MRTDGTLWGWGDSSFGQVGDGNTTSRPTPIQVGPAAGWRSVTAAALHTLALRTDGTLWGWGANSGNQLGDGTSDSRYAPVQIGTATSWQQVSTGTTHTVGIRTNGTLWVWGDNEQGQLGNGQPYSTSVPVVVTSGSGPLSARGARGAAGSLVLVPNPARDMVALPGLGPNTLLRLLDAQGRLVRTGGGARLSLAGLTPGLYLLQATVPGQPARTARLLVE
ncbi:hypothetical protein [Hymenobacter sp. APR13]|uniref:hypothetical protein n=1 Tax=Hymenobacter sp. APR13 TaxID=1356852 RepID=UPI0006932AF7|nr:hypothetical protein [Hymenobacter sp. APR13]